VINLRSRERVQDFSSGLPWRSQKDDFYCPRAVRGNRCYQLLLRMDAGEPAES
jgi:hypothetical protein